MKAGCTYIFWSFNLVGSNRYRLVAIRNRGENPLEVLYSAPYESRKVRDMLAAIWYLNYGTKNYLPDNLVQVLDGFKADAKLQGFETY